MAFKIAAETPTFRRSVKMYIPSGDGVDDSQSLDVTYRALPFSEQRKYDQSTLDGSKGFLDAAIANVEGAIGDDGTAVAWAGNLRAQLYDRPYIIGSLIKGFVEGIAAARLGN